MTEPTQVEVARAGSPAGIKQEHEPDVTGLEGIDFSMLAELASKRPFEDVGQERDADDEQQAAKRLKTENVTAEEELLEDGLALLVQNALSNIGDLVGQFNVDPDEQTHGGSDSMDVDGAHDTEVRLPPVSFLSEPEKYVRIANTHALGNLALSLLLVLLQQPVEDMSKLAGDTDSGYGRSYSRLKRSFEATWELFSSEQVLSADELEIQEADARSFLDMANLAKFATWLIDGGADSFATAEKHFSTIFHCQPPDLEPELSGLNLEIRTQKTIEALLRKEVETQSEDIVRSTMMDGLEEPTEEIEISPAAKEFVASIRSRQDILIQQVKDKEPVLAELRGVYPTGGVLKRFSAHVKLRLASATEMGERLGISALLNEISTEEPISSGPDDGELDLDDLSSFFEKTTSGLVQNALAGLTDEPEVQSTPVVETAETAETAETPAENPGGEARSETTPAQLNGRVDLISDYKELEALVAESTSNYVKTTLHGLSAVPYQPTVPSSTAETMAAQSPYLSHLQQHQVQHPYYSYTQQSPPEQQAPAAGPGDNLPPNQTFPSAILYDKARQAALSKSTAHTRREGLHSTRRPWTQEEEKALMAGLDMVKGPHWSQILTLFGQNGTMSDILKDRTQVQLKDKARNLKLFFLKTNSEMPYYLQAVTGELKTRAPTQAARKEAEERARLNSEEEQAKLQGIMTLAGGLQHPPPQPHQHQQARGPGTAASAVGQSVVTPAQAASAAQAVSSAHHTPNIHHAASTSPANVAPMTRGGMILPNTPQISPQIKSEGQAPAPQTIQGVSPAPARPQSQLSHQAPRPQGQSQLQASSQHHSQHQPQHHQQPGTPQRQSQPNQVQQQQPANSQLPSQQHTPSQARTPSLPPQQIQNGTPMQHSPTPFASSTSTPSNQPQMHFPSPPQPSSTSAQTALPQQPSAPTKSELHRGTPAPEAPMSQSVSQDDDEAAEAALLEGLQAAVAQALAS